MVCNATFNNISVISWQSVLWVEKTIDLLQVTDKLHHIMLYQIHLIISSIQTLSFMMYNNTVISHVQYTLFFLRKSFHHDTHVYDIPVQEIKKMTYSCQNNFLKRLWQMCVLCIYNVLYTVNCGNYSNNKIYLKWPSLPGTYLTRFGGFPGEFWLLTPLNNAQDNQDITNNLLKVL
jgi:hypothetical protein